MSKVALLRMPLVLVLLGLVAFFAGSHRDDLRRPFPGGSFVPERVDAPSRALKQSPSPFPEGHTPERVESSSGPNDANERIPFPPGPAFPPNSTWGGPRRPLSLLEEAESEENATPTQNGRWRRVSIAPLARDWTSDLFAQPTPFRLLLPLFKDRKIEVDVEKRAFVAPQDAVFTGKVTGELFSLFSMTVYKGVLWAAIHTEDGRHYEIGPTSGEGYTVREIQALPALDCPSVADDLPDAPAPGDPIPLLPDTVALDSHLPTTIDLLVTDRRRSLCRSDCAATMSSSPCARPSILISWTSRMPPSRFFGAVRRSWTTAITE